MRTPQTRSMPDLPEDHSGETSRLSAGLAAPEVRPQVLLTFITGMLTWGSGGMSAVGARGVVLQGQLEYSGTCDES